MKPCTVRKQRIVFIHTFWENKGALVRERRTRDLWWKVVPISRGRWLEIKTKTIFYCSYIQCNSFFYLPTEFLSTTLQQRNLQANRRIVSDFYLCPPYLWTTRSCLSFSFGRIFVSNKKLFHRLSIPESLSADSQQLDSTNRYYKYTPHQFQCAMLQL